MHSSVHFLTLRGFFKYFWTLYNYRGHSGIVHGPPDTPSPGSKGTDPEDLDMVVSQPSLDVHLSLSEYWPGFSTVLVDVSPWCLMTNQTDLDLMILEQNGTPWQLPSKKTFTPPKFKVSLSLWSFILIVIYMQFIWIYTVCE